MVKKFLKSLWKGTQNIVGWVGLFIACYSVYSQTLGKDHELTIVVSSLDVHKDQLVVGVLFNNSGDFVETIIDGGISLPTSDFSSEGYHLQDCFEPVTVKAKDAVHKYYRFNVPLYGEHQSETNTVTRPLHIVYDIVMPDGGISNQTKSLGTISHRISDGLIERIESESSLLSVRFDDKGMQDFGNHYIPETYDHELSRYSSCKFGT
ncbi:hypothetical protein AB4622_26865 [Vibrio splendidus]|uniref:hypothetical protein n=1 Tax=Vibrio splendidus TaxID=29497 RepID=UPI00273505E3|nr:hypothetical protein [Vibrio splendidus]MDP2592210.1 hypothetical protein [Vibrio splendidus]